MTLETLLRRMTWMRRGWLILAVISGVFYVVLVPFYLYTAWVQYVLTATGVATYTGVNSWVAVTIAGLADIFERSAFLIGLAGTCFWLAWLWLAASFATRLSPDAPPRFGPWISVICWMVPIVKLFVPLLVMIDIARITVRDDGPQQDPLPEPSGPQGRDLPWLAFSILVFNMVSMSISRLLSQVPLAHFQDLDKGQHLFQLAAVGGVATLLLLLAMDAYIRTLAKAQETRLARLYLDGG